MAVEGPASLDHRAMVGLKVAFEESNLPFTVDVVDLNVVSHAFKQIVKGQRVALTVEQNGADVDAWRETVYGKFPDHFRADTLGNLCVGGNGIQTGPFGSQLHQRDYVSEGTPILTVEHLGQNRITTQDLPRVSDYDRMRLSKYALQKGDVVFSRVGSVDRRALVRQEEEGWLFSGRCLRVRPDPSKIDAGYISYFFGLDSFQEYIRALAVGATMPSLNTQILSDVPILYPSLPEQRAIAHVLGTLDDKIELNRRMNETLEEMAGALFKSWFVDFEPVRAKMEGRWRLGESLPGLPTEHYDLFPDRLVDSELGEIPEGLDVKMLGEVAEVVGGTTPSTRVAEYWEGGKHCWATPKDLSNLSTPVLLDTERKITDAGLDKIGSGLLPADTLLLSSRAPIGYLAISEEPVAINQGFIAMPPRKGTSNLFMLYWCGAFHDEIVNHANGSTFLEISKSNFRRIPLVVPAEEVMTAFDRLASMLHKHVVSNERESRALAVQRDALLPGLVSGELAVRTE